MAKKDVDTGLYLVAMVGIVAVIGLVVLVMNSGSTGTYSYDYEDYAYEDLAGQASKAPGMAGSGYPYTCKVYSLAEIEDSMESEVDSVTIDEIDENIKNALLDFLDKEEIVKYQFEEHIFPDLYDHSVSEDDITLKNLLTAISNDPDNLDDFNYNMYWRGTWQSSDSHQSDFDLVQSEDGLSSESRKAYVTHNTPGSVYYTYDFEFDASYAGYDLEGEGEVSISAGLTSYPDMFYQGLITHEVSSKYKRYLDNKNFFDEIRLYEVTGSGYDDPDVNIHVHIGFDEFKIKKLVWKDFTDVVNEDYFEADGSKGYWTYPSFAITQAQLDASTELQDIKEAFNEIMYSGLFALAIPDFPFASQRNLHIKNIGDDYYDGGYGYSFEICAEELVAEAQKAFTRDEYEGDAYQKAVDIDSDERAPVGVDPMS